MGTPVPLSGMEPSDWRELAPEGPAIVTMGNFDGVHRGHRHLLTLLLDEAGKTGLSPLVLTFLPHTRQVVGNHPDFSLLTPPLEKRELLCAFPGLRVIFLHFTPEVAGMSAGEFAEEVLRKKLQARRLILGPRHRFGASPSAPPSADTLSPAGISTLAASPVKVDGVTVSSSAIRLLLGKGDVEAAGRMLGRSFAYTGTVVHGDGRGRELGFPTANLDPGEPGKLMVHHGVYAARAILEGKEHQALVSIGTNPTFSGRNLRIEAYLLRFSGDIYSQKLTLNLDFMLRKEKKFDSAADLARQIRCDLVEIDQTETQEKWKTALRVQRT